MRPASEASSLCAIDGTSSSTAMKWRWLSSSSVQSDLADDRRGARAVVEQRQLADDGAGPERRDLLAVALHHHRTLEHDERFAAGLTLIDDQRAGRHDDFVARLGDLFQVLLRTRREQRDFTKVVEVRLFAGHAAECRHPACAWSYRAIQAYDQPPGLGGNLRGCGGDRVGVAEVLR